MTSVTNDAPKKRGRPKKGEERQRIQINGKRIYVYAGGKRDLQRTVRKLQVDVERGDLDLRRKTPTFAEFGDEWFAGLRPRPLGKYSQTTIDGYRRLYDLRLRPILHDVHLHKIGPRHVTVIQNAVLDAGLAVQTARNTRNLLSKILGAAKFQQLIRANPCDMVEPLEGTPGQGEALEQEELARLLRALRGDRFEAGFLLAFMLGLRRSEILGLSWNAIDLDRGQLVIRQTMHRSKTQGIVFQTPKTKRSQRVLALAARLVESLRQRQQAQDDDQIAAGERWRNGERRLVFTTHDGGPYEPSHFTHQIKATLREVGAGDHRGHDLRHTTSSTLQSRGLSPQGTMGVMGHTSPDMTMGVYGHLLDADRKAAARIMDAYLDELDGLAEERVSGEKMAKNSPHREVAV